MSANPNTRLKILQFKGEVDKNGVALRFPVMFQQEGCYFLTLMRSRSVSCPACRLPMPVWYGTDWLDAESVTKFEGTFRSADGTAFYFFIKYNYCVCKNACFIKRYLSVSEKSTVETVYWVEVFVPEITYPISDQGDRSVGWDMLGYCKMDRTFYPLFIAVRPFQFRGDAKTRMATRRLRGQ